MTNKRVKTLPPKELDHFLSTEIFFMNKRRKHGQEYKPTKISNFQRRIAQTEKKRRTCTFLHPNFVMRKLKYSMQDREKPFSEFQQTAAVEKIVLEALFIFNVIYVH